MGEDYDILVIFNKKDGESEIYHAKKIENKEWILKFFDDKRTFKEAQRFLNE